jgi:hypothetical protein
VRPDRPAPTTTTSVTGRTRERSPESTASVAGAHLALGRLAGDMGQAAVHPLADDVEKLRVGAEWSCHQMANPRVS